MESPMTAIGFSEIDKKYTIEQLVSEILEKPTKQQASRKESKDVVAEYLKEFGKDMYMAVRIVAKADKEQSHIEVEQCEPFLDTKYIIKVEELTVEEIDDEYNYYVICEEKETGMQFIFWLQNVIEYNEASKDRQVFNAIKIAALAMEGTIILPIEKDAEYEAEEKEEREKLKLMLQKARQGDEDAQAQLEAEEKEMDEELKERLYNEDFLTIMSGYFVPTTLIDANYAVLGEIKEIKIRKNSKTNEEMYLFTLDINEMPLDVIINKKQLIGCPSVGMRFMGTCWLQGTIVVDEETS